MADVLFRGRGANVGTRAPMWMVRLCGAALAFAVFSLADSLGVFYVTGKPEWSRLLVLPLGAILASTRAGALLWLAVGVLTTATFVVSYTPLVQASAHAFVRTDPPRLDMPPDAVVVLSGGLNHDGRLNGQALDRLLAGLNEVGARSIGVIALSVVTAEDHGTRVSSESDQRALVALVAPRADLRFVRDVHSTRDEAMAFAAMARTHGWTRVMLITSPLHSRRACATFETAGLSVECRPAPPRVYSVERLEIPFDRREVFADVMYETAATLLYASRGWIP